MTSSLTTFILIAAAASVASSSDAAAHRHVSSKRRRVGGAAAVQRALQSEMSVESPPPSPSSSSSSEPVYIGVTLAGQIYYDIDKNSNRDANEPGVPDVTVQIRSCTNARMGSTRSNSIGEFFFTLAAPGCYYARLDASSNTFTDNSDVDPSTGRTDPIELEDGEGKYWYIGMLPPDVDSTNDGDGSVGSSNVVITALPTRRPSLSSTTEEPSASVMRPFPPTRSPTARPTKMPTDSPTVTSSPSDSPTISTAPTACIVDDAYEDNIMSSAPILRKTFGVVFSVSTPPRPDAEGAGPSVVVTGGGGSSAAGGGKGGVSNHDVAEDEEHILITSLSLRTSSPLHLDPSPTNYQVWFREGEYAELPKGDLLGWSLVAGGSSSGSKEEESLTSSEEEEEEELKDSTEVGEEGLEDQQEEEVEVGAPMFEEEEEEESGGAISQEGGEFEGGSQVGVQEEVGSQEQAGGGGITQEGEVDSQTQGGGAGTAQEEPMEVGGAGGVDSDQGEGEGGSLEEEGAGNVPSEEGGGESSQEQGGGGGTNDWSSVPDELVSEVQEDEAVEVSSQQNFGAGEGGGSGQVGLGGSSQQQEEAGFTASVLDEPMLELQDEEVQGGTTWGVQEQEVVGVSDQGSWTRALREENDDHNPFILDSNFLSGALPSDNNNYKSQPSTLLPDGGMETLTLNGSPVKTYLYQIPKAVFKPILIPKYGGKVSIYVTLDRASMQYGDAGEEEFDLVDVENSEYDPNGHGDDIYQSMNVRIHVGEGVTSYPWSHNPFFYQPRRFLGKVWYEQMISTPCHLHETYPSVSPSYVVIPELPGASSVDKNNDAAAAAGEVVAGEPIKTRFVISLFLQQDINSVTKMDEEVQDVFRSTVVDFLNEEWVKKHCVWAVSLDPMYQKLSLLEGVRRYLLRGGGGESPPAQKKQHRLLHLGSMKNRRWLQTDLTILQVEASIEGVAYDDPDVCPEGATPATPTSNGKDWEETMAWYGIDYINDNSDRLGSRLKVAHAYFANTFATAADPELLSRSESNNPTNGADAADPVMETEENSFPLIPVIAACAAAALLLCLLGCFCFFRRSKRRQNEQPEELQKEDAPAKLEQPVETAEIDSTEQDNPSKPEEAAPNLEEQMEDDGYTAQDVESVSTTSPVDDEEEDKYLDPLIVAMQELRHIPTLEDTVMTRGLPRRRSEPKMTTIYPAPILRKRSKSLGCLREIWINLNKPGDEYVEELLNGTLYPIDDIDILYMEREKQIMGDDVSAPYVPHGSSIEHNFIDDEEAYRIEEPPSPEAPEAPPDYKEYNKQESAVSNNSDNEFAAPKKVNPLVMQQVEMLEAKWKQLREEYDDDGEHSDDEFDLENFDVNARIDQLMGHIEKLEMERKMRLAQLKRQEGEEEELARKRMVRAGQGINYNQEFNKEFVIRSTKKGRKKKEVDDLDLDDLSSESSSEEEAEDGDYDVKWMRLKVPLAAQDPEAMKSLVKKGKGLN